MLGKMDKLIEKSGRRRYPMCPKWKSCGGCALMHVQYKEQCKMKEQIVKESLRKYANYQGKVEPLMKNPNPLGYRNLCKFVLKKEQGVWCSGMYATNSHDFVAIDRCMIHEKKIEEVRSQLLALMNQYEVDGFKQLVIKDFNQKVQVLFITEDVSISSDFIAACSQIEGLVSLWQNIKTDYTKDIFGQEMIHLAGLENIELTLDDKTLRLLPRSFFQLNTEQAIHLYDLVAQWTPKSNVLVEAYSGIGAISLFVKDQAKEIIGIESIQDAVDNANENAKLNNAEHVSFLCADAGKALKEIVQKKTVDTLIVDPPRTGLNTEMKDTILSASIQNIIYVSCNPATLGKDLKQLQQCYNIKKVQPIDMFSQTPHVETVVLLSKGEINSKKVRVEFSLEDMDMSGFQNDATYGQIKERVLQQTGLKVSSLYIAQVKQKYGIIERENYNKPKSENAKQPKCPPEKEAAITEALKFFGMI